MSLSFQYITPFRWKRKFVGTLNKDFRVVKIGDQSNRSCSNYQLFKLYFFYHFYWNGIIFLNDQYISKRFLKISTSLYIWYIYIDIHKYKICWEFYWTEKEKNVKIYRDLSIFHVMAIMINAYILFTTINTCFQTCVILWIVYIICHGDFPSNYAYTSKYKRQIHIYVSSNP